MTENGSGVDVREMTEQQLIERGWSKEMQEALLRHESTQDQLLKALWNRKRKRLWSAGLAFRRIAHGSVR